MSQAKGWGEKNGDSAYDKDESSPYTCFPNVAKLNDTRNDNVQLV